MINNDIVLTEFRQLIPFRASNSSEVGRIDTALTVGGITNKYVQDLHPLLSLQILKECANSNSLDFSAYLGQRRDFAILQLCDDILKEKQVYETATELLAEVKMFDGSGNKNDQIIKQNRFVGFKITGKYPDIALLVKSIGLQVSQTQTKLPVYIYHSSKQEHVYKLELDYTKAYSFQFISILRKTLSSIEGGYWIVGYYETDLQGQAINKSQIFTGCASCGLVDYFAKWNKYITIQPFYVTSDNLDGINKWVENAEIEIDNTNFGMNIQFSIYCDYSGLFSRNSEIFADALGAKIALTFLEDIFYTAQKNQTAIVDAQKAGWALGDPQKREGGLYDVYKKAIKALDFSSSELSPVCLPCKHNGFKLKITSR